jgi:hypothetical protein
MPWRHLPTHSTAAIEYSLFLVNAVWGLDYIIPPYKEIQIAPVWDLTDVAPLWVWGTVMLVAGCAGILADAAMTLHQPLRQGLWVVPFLSHTVLGSIFLIFTVAAMMSVIREPGWEGYRHPALWFLITVIHTTFATYLYPPERRRRG